LGLLNTIRREADPAVAEEPGEGFPADQHVVHGLGDRRVPGQLAAALAHPGLELGDQRRDVLPAKDEPRCGGQVVNGALGVKDGVDPPHRLDGERGAQQLGQLEQLAPAMRPTPGLGDRPRLSVGLVERVVAGIGIGLQDAGIAGQVPVWVLGRPVA
jgi:hypothetical protein